MKWDLTDLYKSTSDPSIAKDKKLVELEANKFTKKYKNKLKTSAITLKALREYENLLERLYSIAYFAGFHHSTDTKSTTISRFYQETSEFAAQIESSLVWFELELAKTKFSVKGYDYLLEKLRKKQKYMLSEPEENILTQKSQTSRDAFVRFYDETNSQLLFELQVGKTKKKLTGTEIGKIMSRHEDRALRQKATQVMSKNYSEHSHFYTFTLNMLLLDKKISDGLRGYQYPQQSTYLNYDVDPKTVDAMVNVVTKSYSISERFYIAKAKLLKQKLHEWDRYTPLYNINKSYSWEETKKIVLDSFYEFDKQFGDIAKKFLDNHWVDAKITKNRASGAYCSYLTPSKHPYIFMNFDGKVDDITTLAHELGHGIHAYLSREQSMVNFFPSTATAEIASIFAESLVFDHLYKTAKSKKEKANLLAEKIQGSFATVFRQTGFHLFETDIHTYRRQNGELSAKDFSDYYQQRLQPMFGKGLKLTEDHKYFWMPILHFYHYNFYVFTYAFGELLSLSIYNMYKTKPDKFTEQYIKLLKKGGSQSPKDLLKGLDQDISDKKFWQKGLGLLDNYVLEFEKMLQLNP